MNLRITLFATAILVTACAVPAFADEAPAPAPQPQAQPKPKAPKTELEKHMGAMGKAMRQLKAQIKDATKNEDSIALVAKIKEEAQKAIENTPAKAADVPEGAERAKFVADYQAGMKKLLTALDAVTDALKAGDNAAAAKAFGQVSKTEREGHNQFRRKDD